MPAKKEIPFPERRKYVRLDSVFPVQFRLLEPDGNNFLSDWIQGFTSNIGSGGICLEVNKLKPEVLQAIRSRQARFALEIEMPLGAHPVKAKTSIVWVKDDPDEPGGRCIIGLAYENIDPAQNHRIVRYALTKKLVAPLALAFGLIFAAGFGINTYYNFKLIEGNRALVTKLLGVLQDSALAKQKMTQIIQDKEGLQLKLQSLQQRIGSLEEEKAAIKEEAGKINQLNALIEKLNLEKSGLQKQLTELRHRENAVNYELVNLEKKKAVLEQINFDKMYQWLKVHQNPRTGLVMSFEGDGNLSNAAFIYDQSLATQVYTIYSDFERARKVFDFFENKAERKDGRFLNAYYANDGSPAEFIVHSGPNIWLGIAVLQYTAKSRDRAYLNLAEEIARSMIALQNEDPESGIRGGPDVSWYATEHNLDAYAFFNMLYTTIPKKEYGLARDKALAWLVSHTYDSTEVPIKRGKGDSTIATDTYAWSIAAVGPEKLEELGMSPDRIMEFAEQNCAVEVLYNRPDGRTLKIKGFDFAARRHLARGGIVSSEWTAQMVISFKIMADFNYKKGATAKARAYEAKVQEYMTSLGNMVISSPSPSGQGESCLPYATQEFVDTGHGWMTPKGNSTGSVAGTAYTIFAHCNYNPLKLKQ